MPTASGNPKKNGGLIVDAFKRYGADASLIPLALNAKKMDDLDYKEVRKDPRWVDAVKGAGLVYFIGGTQERIVKALYEDDGSRSPMLQAIWDVYELGRRGRRLVGGCGDHVRPDVPRRQNVFQVLRNGARFWDVLQGDPPNGEETTRGLGFIRAGWFVDQHFLTRGRFARALVVMRDRKMKYGLGVDENTALVVTGGNEAEVIGYKGVPVHRPRPGQLRRGAAAVQRDRRQAQLPRARRPAEPGDAGDHAGAGEGGRPARSTRTIAEYEPYYTRRRMVRQRAGQHHRWST